MRLSNIFKIGQEVVIKNDSDPFPNGPSHMRTGIDVTDEGKPFGTYPIEMDLRGKTGTIINEWTSFGDPRVEVQVPYDENRKANFLVPSAIIG